MFSFHLACDGTGILSTNNGKMRSPEYQYGKHQVFLCQWLVKAPQNYNIHLSLTYTTSSVISNSSCSKHFVEIFNGSFPTNTSLGRICENINSRTIIIKGSSTYVMLWIDSDLDAKERPRFSADYKFVLKQNQVNTCLFYNSKHQLLHSNCLKYYWECKQQIRSKCNVCWLPPAYTFLQIFKSDTRLIGLFNCWALFRRIN